MQIPFFVVRLLCSFAHMSCVLCNSNNYKFYDEENGYSYMQCIDCSCIFLYPRINEVDRQKAVNLGMHPGNKPLNTKGKIKNKKMAKYVSILKKLELDKRLLVAENTLDIGAGHGEWALLMRDCCSAKSHAVEPQLDKHKQLQLENIVCFKTLEEVTMQYDLVSLLNVFSHLPKPNDTINTIYALTKTKGYFVIQTGNTAHLDSKKHPKPYLAPDHLQFTNKETLVKWLEKAGFKVLNTLELLTQNSINHPEFYKALIKFLLGKVPFSNLRYAHTVSDLWIVCQKV